MSSTGPAEGPNPEARAVLHSRARVLKWYRLDQSQEISRILFFGALLLIPGSLLVAAAVAPWAMDPYTRLWISAVGFSLTAGGPAWTLWHLRSAMSVDAYLALRTDGVLYVAGEQPRLVPWEDIDEVVHDGETDAVRLELRGDQELLLENHFAGTQPESLTKLIATYRRKAVWGLLEKVPS